MNKLCNVCKVEKSISEFYKCRRNNDGLQSICKLCKLEYQRTHLESRHKAQKKYAMKNKEKKHDYRVSLHGRYIYFKNAAKSRDILFQLSEEEFISLISQNCFYDNKEGPVTGLDRIDNSIGYILSNVVPCCYECNIMKHTSSQEEFFMRCLRIVQHHSLF